MKMLGFLAAVSLALALAVAAYPRSFKANLPPGVSWVYEGENLVPSWDDRIIAAPFDVRCPVCGSVMVSLSYASDDLRVKCNVPACELYGREYRAPTVLLEEAGNAP